MSTCDSEQLPNRSAAPGLCPLFRRAWIAAATLAVSTAFGGCASDDIASFEDIPPAEELYAQGMETLEGTRILGLFTLVDYNQAIETFQTIIDNYPYSEFARQAELRIADAYYDDGRWDEALSYYRDFADLHPNDEMVPYTMLRAALCHYEQIESPNRDQTATREALSSLEALIRAHPYAPETREGEELLRSLRGRLARSIMDTGDFYMKRDEWQAAAERYRTVLDSYPGLGVDAEALFKLAVCYENMKRRDEARRLFLVIVENFRETELADQAADHIAESY